MSTNFPGRLWRNLPLLLLCTALIGALASLWSVRRIPIALPFMYVDALAAFVVALVCAGLALAHAARSDWPLLAAVRVLGLAALAAAMVFSAVPVVAMLLLLATLTLAVVPSLRRPVVALPLVLAGLAALVAGLALTLHGALRYDSVTAGAALDSLVFWFSLLAAVIPALPLAVPDEASDDAFSAVVRLLCWYPLARLFTIGPWNDGWSLAAMLLGGGAACWAALAALTRPSQVARALAAQRFLLGLAVGAIGLASSAGVAASCYALLCYALLCTYSADGQPRWVSWVMSGALPLSASFMACWLAIGAAAASGATALAGVLWLAALVRGVAILLEPPVEDGSRPVWQAGIIPMAVGVLAPLIIASLIQPIVDQLQGGLTPYGNLSIAPWVGLALLNSGSQAITTAPTLAAAGLMLVLVALVFLLARLWQRPDQHAPTSEPSVGVERTTLIANLVRAVPWLAAFGSHKDRDHDHR